MLLLPNIIRGGIITKDLFGIYNLRSRICVCIFLLAPTLIEIYIFCPQVFSLTNSILILLLLYSFSNLIIIISRQYGCKALFKCFPNGFPAQNALISNNTFINKHMQERYCTFFSNHIDSFHVSTDENDMKIQAEIAISWLISRTRDSSKFPLIEEENINLGFSYNLLGVKPFGIFISISLLILNLILLFLRIYTIKNIIGILSNILFIIIWISFINKKLVQNCGKKYARALLSACDSKELNS